MEFIAWHKKGQGEGGIFIVARGTARTYPCLHGGLIALRHREEEISSRGKRGWIKKRRSFAVRDDLGPNQRDNANRYNLVRAI